MSAAMTAMPQPRPSLRKTLAAPRLPLPMVAQVDAARAPGEEREGDRPEQVGQHHRERLVHGSLTVSGLAFAAVPRKRRQRATMK